MSRKKHRNRQKKAARERHRSGIDAHQQQGSRLVPPFLQRGLPISLKSWTNDRLPEMIWALLLVCPKPREYGLDLIRDALARARREGWIKEFSDMTLTALGRSPDALKKLLTAMCHQPQIRSMLRPMLLFPGLPGRSVWESAIGEAPVLGDWATLAGSVARSLGHQSQEATDARWVRVCFMVAAEKLKLPARQTIREVLDYPHVGDQRSVRPFIRSTEGAVSTFPREDPPDRVWVDHFWSHCYGSTECAPWPTSFAETKPSTGTTRSRIRETRAALIEAQKRATTTTAVDPRLDIVFGMAAYSLTLLDELMRVGADRSVGARLYIRCLVETAVTLRYLVRLDDPELWRTYRVYGAGQAKLSSLKFEDVTVPPGYIDAEMIRAIANEDVWEEFLNIDLGHWEKTNLRQIAMKAGLKELYDQYYGWPSSYTHAQWGAVREVEFDTCGNPLHRLHRVLRVEGRSQPDAVPDAVRLVDEALIAVDEAYRPFPARVGELRA